MSNMHTLITRNKKFAKDFTKAELPILPNLRMVILSCVDARVDPAHIFKLELGEAVVIRNNGGRVTKAAIEEIAGLAAMVAMMDGDKQGGFELVLLQHTQCGAERFTNPDMQKMFKEKLGIDVSESAIHDHNESLVEDVERLRSSPNIPKHIITSGYIYDVQNGQVQEIIAPSKLG
ncbi:MAG: hypothetical protein COB13_000480 [OCS116 cluster bacterium]|uniref:Carbonic anhydrase n=1 Tax=OCS116 cluster bacterium TaxID=2030921 RepID=A0A2A4YU55_9PROT|nr:hypothetical protein [OCS116 cluster bacterium]